MQQIKDFKELTVEEKCIIEKLLEERLEKVEWSKTQLYERKRPKWRNKNLIGKVVTFTEAVAVKIRRSHFGKYMEPSNYQQFQDVALNVNKWGIDNFDLTHSDPEDVAEYIHDDDFTDEPLKLLQQAVENIPIIDWSFLYKTLMVLRLIDYSITKVDIGLQLYENLQMLILTGNWIEIVPGAYLPRKLQFLELYYNKIANLSSLCCRTPKRLKHLGLGRNPLTNSSSLHLLVKCKNFLQLRTIDLGDCDICALDAALHAISRLPTLAGIVLAGNPCSVASTYKDLVLEVLPNLTILDGTQITKADRNYYSAEQINAGLQDTQLTFTCHRLIGLPQPPKDVINKQKVQSFFHMEVTIPLLEEYKTEPEPPEPEQQVEESHGKLKKNKNKKGGKKGAGTSKGKKKGASKKGKEDSPYSAPDEHELEINLKIKNNSFKTDRIPWAKITQFPENALSVKVPENIENKLTLMRDTFRAVANVKAVFTQILPPPKVSKKAKKGKKEKKSKVKDKKDKNKVKDKKDKNKKIKGSKSRSTTAVVTPEPEPEPTETVVKKITLANFNCELSQPNWATKTVDYYWCRHKKFPPNFGIQVEGSLRDIKYSEAKKKKKGGTKGKNKNKGEKKGKEKKSASKDKNNKKEGKKIGKASSKHSKSSIKSGSVKKGKKPKGVTIEEEENFEIMRKAPAEDIFPDVFTVQVGFGLNRTPPTLQSLSLPEKNSPLSTNLVEPPKLLTVSNDKETQQHHNIEISIEKQ